MSGRPPEPGRGWAALAAPGSPADAAPGPTTSVTVAAPVPCSSCGAAHPPPPAVPGPPPGADVWRIGLDIGEYTLDPVASLLDSRERERAARTRDRPSADRYVLTHGAVRTILGGYLGVAGCAVHWSAGRHGKPAFDGPLSHWRWSLSRSAEHALLAVCLSAPVGVDIERVDERTPAVALAARFLPLDEAASVAAQKTPHAARVAYHRLLSRKEACVKASGGRLLDGLRLNVLTPGTVHGTGAMAGHRWQLRDLSAPPGFVATLAVLDGEGRGLRLFDWGWRAPGPEPGNFRPAAPSSASDQASCSLPFGFQRSPAEAGPRGECSR